VISTTTPVPPGVRLLQRMAEDIRGELLLQTQHGQAHACWNRGMGTFVTQHMHSHTAGPCQLVPWHRGACPQPTCIHLFASSSMLEAAWTRLAAGAGRFDV
jgi:hypothetical protein